MNSTTGLSPAMAAPVAIPANPVSSIRGQVLGNRHGTRGEEAQQENPFVQAFPEAITSWNRGQGRGRAGSAHSGQGDQERVPAGSP